MLCGILTRVIETMLDYYSKPSKGVFNVPVIQKPLAAKFQEKTFAWYSTDANISTLQMQIIRSVLNRSGGKYRIGAQNNSHLRVLMYNTFNEHKVFDGGIAQFNELVVLKATEIIMININDSLYYRDNMDNVSMRSTHWQTGIMDHPERVDEDMSLMFSMRM